MGGGREHEFALGIHVIDDVDSSVSHVSAVTDWVSAHLMRLIIVVYLVVVKIDAI